MSLLKNRTIISDIIKDFSSPEKWENKEVKLMGWLRSVRKSKNVAFLVLNDGSHQENIQVVVDQSLPDFEEVGKMLMGCCVEIDGKLVKSQGKGQAIEMQALKINVLGSVNESYPLQKKATSLEFLREVAHLKARTNTFGAVYRIRHALTYATHDFFHSRGFYSCHSPIITASDSEGAGQMFQVTTLPLDGLQGKVDYNKDFFGKKSYLTVSGQLNAECLALGLGKVYTFGPTFRAENSNTPRHLAEFWMIEPEAAFYDLEDTIELAADYIKHLIRYAFETCGSELQYLAKNMPHIIPGKTTEQAKAHLEMLQQVMESEFKSVTYTEAVKILEEAMTSKKKKFEFKPYWGCDLQTEHERYLTEEHFKAPVAVTDYPKEIKAFYMKLNSDNKTVRAMDVLVPGIGELIGGSQREENFDLLSNRIKELNLSEDDYKWYLDLRRFGSAPHSGFGLGFERAVMYITGMTNIRDVIPFSRSPKSAEF